MTRPPERKTPPITNPGNLLMDVLVHGQDIAVPLGIERSMPTDAAVAGFERVWKMGRPFHARRRLRGIHLAVTDGPSRSALARSSKASWPTCCF